jgi:uncharacterized phage protein (TIGR01671 family)
LEDKLKLKEMNRESQFRAWDSISKSLWGWSIINQNPLSDFNLEHYHLMQYTGLKDKNGVEIYEGDVLTNIHIFGVDDEDYCEVVFSGGCFMAKYSFQSLNLIEDSNELEIVGNIHQHSELLNA